MFGGGVSNLTDTLKRNRKLLTVTVILIVAVFLVVINNSFAYFEKRIDASCISLDVGTISYNIKKEVIVPSSSTITTNLLVKKTHDEIDKYQLVYSSDDDLTNVNVGYSSKSTNKSYGSLNKNEEKEIKIVIRNNSDSEKTIYIDVKGISVSDSFDDVNLNKNEYKITSEIEEVTLNEIFLTKADTTTSIDFSEISSETNGRGIYKYQEDKEDIYYYRGKVTDNHVIFGGYCWEMIRTTKTGGVKMIYDGTPVEGKCTNTGEASQIGTSAFNENSNDNAYVGYMYGNVGASTFAETHHNANNSTIKSYIDNWFSTSSLNTSENLEKIEDTVYCSDRSISSRYDGNGIGTNQTYYGFESRLAYDVSNKVPSLNCINQTDRFTVSRDNGNGALIYPVGLITADEVALAGGVYGNSNSDYYLYTGQYFWALSPYNFGGSGVREFDVYSDGRLNDGGYVYNTRGVRPVVSLAAGAEFTENGDGTENNPYVVK